MSLINRFKKELFLKILYIGPSRSGKSENLRQVYDSMENVEKKGFLIHNDPEKTPERQSLFFDFLPISLGSISDYQVRLHLFSIPGSRKYDGLTRHILRGVDGLVMVLSALPDAIDDNTRSLQFASDLLKSYGKSWGDLPAVFQFTHIDSPRALPQETLHQLYNPMNFPEFLAVPPKGKGVMETLRGITHEALYHFKTDESQTGPLPTDT